MNSIMYHNDTPFTLGVYYKINTLLSNNIPAFPLGGAEIPTRGKLNKIKESKHTLILIDVP